MITLSASGRSDTGRVRQSNQDHFFIGVVRRTLDVQDTNLAGPDPAAALARMDAHLLVVADGVGGVAGGERASQSAVSALTAFISQSAACQFDPGVDEEDAFLLRLEQAMERAHAAVRSLGGARHGPATTVTLAMVIGARAYIAHAGDSRAYHFRRGRLRQVTRDQTVAEMLADAGVPPAAGAADRLAGTLMSALGSETMEPAIGLIDLAPDDVLLLCTDGLTKHVPDERIAELLGAHPEAAAACEGLVEEALEGGGTDNVTAIVARAGG